MPEVLAEGLAIAAVAFGIFGGLSLLIWVMDRSGK